MRTPGQLRTTAGRNISAARNTELLTVPWCRLIGILNLFRSFSGLSIPLTKCLFVHRCSSLFTRHRGFCCQFCCQGWMPKGGLWFSCSLMFTNVLAVLNFLPCCSSHTVL